MMGRAGWRRGGGGGGGMGCRRVTRGGEDGGGGGQAYFRHSDGSLSGPWVLPFGRLARAAAASSLVMLKESLSPAAVASGVGSPSGWAAARALERWERAVAGSREAAVGLRRAWKWAVKASMEGASAGRGSRGGDTACQNFLGLEREREYSS